MSRPALLSAPLLIWFSAFFAVPIVVLLVGGVFVDSKASLAAASAYVIDPLYRTVLLNSVVVATVTTLGALLLAYPGAYWLVRLGPTTQKVLMLATFLPLALGAVIKTFGWIILLRANGPLNTLLLSLGIIEQPLRLVFTRTALFVGMISVFLPFMLIPLYTVFRGIDPNLTRAAQTLGAPALVAFWKVVVPLSLPGAVAGAGVVFSLAIGAYVTPTLLVGDNYPTLSTTIARAYLLLSNQAVAATASTLLLAISVGVLTLTGRWQGRR